MNIGKVVGNVVASVKIPSHQGQKLMLVREVDERGREVGKILVAMDQSSAGIGEYVLFSTEGGVCKLTLGETVITDAVILGVLDDPPPYLHTAIPNQ